MTEMTKKLPEFKSAEEESKFWDDPKNVEDYFADAEEVQVDFSEARKARKARPEGVILYKPRPIRKLRKAAG